MAASMISELEEVTARLRNLILSNCHDPATLLGVKVGLPVRIFDQVVVELIHQSMIPPSVMSWPDNFTFSGIRFDRLGGRKDV